LLRCAIFLVKYTIDLKPLTVEGGGLPVGRCPIYTRGRQLNSTFLLFCSVRYVPLNSPPLRFRPSNVFLKPFLVSPLYFRCFPNRLSTPRLSSLDPPPLLTGQSFYGQRRFTGLTLFSLRLFKQQACLLAVPVMCLPVFLTNTWENPVFVNKTNSSCAGLDCFANCFPRVFRLLFEWFKNKVLLSIAR